MGFDRSYSFFYDVQCLDLAGYLHFMTLNVRICFSMSVCDPNLRLYCLFLGLIYLAGINLQPNALPTHNYPRIGLPFTHA